MNIRNEMGAQIIELDHHDILVTKENGETVYKVYWTNKLFGERFVGEHYSLEGAINLAARAIKKSPLLQRVVQISAEPKKRFSLRQWWKDRKYRRLRKACEMYFNGEFDEYYERGFDV